MLILIILHAFEFHKQDLTFQGQREKRREIVSIEAGNKESLNKEGGENRE